MVAFAGTGAPTATDFEDNAPDPAEPLLREAALHSPVLLEQELKVAQADAFRFRGWRQYMPYINANYQAGYFNLLGASAPGAQTGKGIFGGSYAINANYPVYQWGAIEAEKKFAFARENSARVGASITWRNLVKDVRSKFLEAVVDKARIALLEKRVEAARVRQERTEQEFAIGRIIAADRAAGLLELRNKELDLSRQKIALATLLSQLRGLTGAENFGVTDIPDDLPDIDWDDEKLATRLAEFEKLSVEDSPENKQAEYDAEQYKNQRIMAEARDLPSFNLGASVTQTPVQNGTNFGMQTYLFLGVTGTWNIFDRDTTQENVRAPARRRTARRDTAELRQQAAVHRTRQRREATRLRPAGARPPARHRETARRGLRRHETPFENGHVAARGTPRLGRRAPLGAPRPAHRPLGHPQRLSRVHGRHPARPDRPTLHRPDQ